jgi:hypothetical protein
VGSRRQRGFNPRQGGRNKPTGRANARPVTGSALPDDKLRAIAPYALSHAPARASYSKRPCHSLGWAGTAPNRRSRKRSNRQREASSESRNPCSRRRTGRHRSASFLRLGVGRPDRSASIPIASAICSPPPRRWQDLRQPPASNGLLIRLIHDPEHRRDRHHAPFTCSTS